MQQEPTESLAQLKDELASLRAEVEALRPGPANHRRVSAKRMAILAGVVALVCLGGFAGAQSDLFYIDNEGLHFGGATIDEAGNLTTSGGVVAETLDVTQTLNIGGDLHLGKTSDDRKKLLFGDGQFAYLHEFEDDHLKLHAAGVTVDSEMTVEKSMTVQGNMTVDGELRANVIGRLQGTLNGARVEAGAFRIAKSCSGIRDCPVYFKKAFASAPICTISMEATDTTGYREAMVLSGVFPNALYVWRGVQAGTAGTTQAGNYICVGS